MFDLEIERESFNFSYDEKMLLLDLINDKITITEFIKLSKDYCMTDNEQRILRLIALKKQAIKNLIKDEFTIDHTVNVANETISVDTQILNGTWGKK